jgi:hypothetical protein
MPEKRTVLVLGAGASQPFGFPTGRELSNLVTHVARGKGLDLAQIVDHADGSETANQGRRALLADVRGYGIGRYLFTVFPEDTTWRRVELYINQEAVGAHKTSMLQDVEAGRSLETETLIGSVLEMAKLTETPAPPIEAVYACVKLPNKVMLLEGGGVKVAKVETAKAA